MTSSIVIPVLNKQRFEYSYLGNSGSESITLVPALDVISFNRITLLVRVHRISSVVNQAFNFHLYSTLPSEEDPQEFTDTASNILTVNVAGGTSSPALLSATTTAPPAFLKLVLTASQGSTTGGNTLYGEFSACLLGREN